MQMNVQQIKLQKSAAFLPIWLFGACILYLLFCKPSYAADAQVSQIFKQLSATATVRADFQQQKKLAALNKTFVSNGTVLFLNSRVCYGKYNAL